MNRRKFPRAALCALALCLLISALMLVSPAASGQKGGRVAEELGQVLESFETVTLDPAEVLRSAREQGSVTLRTARGDFDLAVEPYDVRTDGYRAVAMGADGVATELARTPSNSWRGQVRGQDGTVVRLYLDGEKVHGVIITPSQTFFVEPASGLSSAAGSKEFVFYESASVKATDAECAEATLGGKVAAEAARTKVAADAAKGTPPADELFLPKRQADVATEADFEFFQANGSNQTATINDITNIMTQVDGVYEAQLGVRIIKLASTRVWTNSNDPYFATDASDLLEEFADKYDASFGTLGPPQRDLTHLFTGKNIDTDTSDGDTIGIAFRGVVCNFPDGAYGLSQSRFTTANASRVALTAHEIGHNFGATHTDTEDPPVPDSCANFIMGSELGQGTQLAFCQFSRDQITSHITAYGNIPVSGVACLSPQITAGCSYAITPASQFFTAAGGTGTVNVTSNCPWGVAEGAPWLTFASESGSGSGSVGYTVAANANTGPREALVDIGAQTLTIRQAAAAACSSTPISIGQTVGGSLASSDCRAGLTDRVNAFIDLYTFTARAGQRVRIQMTAAQQPTSNPPPDAALDTFLYLFGPDGSIIASNDDIDLGEDTDSSIPVGGFITLPVTGIYTIEATSFDNEDAGNYTLTLVDNSSTNTVSFSSSAYAVDEGTAGGGLGADGTGFRVVTVTRTGTTSGTALVDYATSDGTATRLKDYEQTLGTLVFAPGETSKTFTVFVPDDAFAEGAETVQLTLSNPVGATLGTSAATLTINSNDATDGPSPVRAQSFNGAFFVRQHYLDFLNREPDTSGFNFWQGQLTNCSNPPPADLMVCRVNVSAAFFQAIEFQNTGFYVYRAYKAAYGDATSPNVPGTVPVIRLNEFLPDTQRIGQGLIVGAPGWEQVLAANKQAYTLEFVLRPRFLTAFPLTMTPAQYVDKLVQNAGLTLTAAERDALIAQFNSTADVAAARAAVLSAVAENAQLRATGTAEWRRAFVLMQYYGYLRRDPDTGPNTDFGGWFFWLGKLNEFGGNFVQAEMVKAFLESTEYIDRFGTRP